MLALSALDALIESAEPAIAHTLKISIRPQLRRLIYEHHPALNPCRAGHQLERVYADAESLLEAGLQLVQQFSTLPNGDAWIRACSRAGCDYSEPETMGAGLKERHS
jgi:hypothetical protein